MEVVMKLFDTIFSKSEIILGSPMSGECIAVNEVNDPTFKEELLGKGVAIIPSAGKIYAPCDGKIAMVFSTGHAVAMITQEGIELLIHFGMDTVKLKGRYFTVKVGEGDSVKKGDLLIDVDIEQIKKEGYEVTTPVVVTNSNDFSKIVLETGNVKVGDNIMRIRK